ncbi:LysR family transcriptional regulator [Pokkaliibacter plantistimulans]|uniref:LysR family transcriptional regulator n=1 Tax=Proteobacteria bacterium 228 TaxID=2083153 RepID=A0A2S5KLI4_9PROT|nr:LysR family transcriptional regulator [Pokkaliibacter plantistimulans]PPC75694.1 LysR family transcriptional regulator [Pokkaliibacter plantistimulans]
MRYFDPVSLRLFVAVCEENSVLHAAEREAIVPSAVSKRLTALEEQAGVDLLIRSRKGVTLTPAGQSLLRYARQMLNSMEAMHAELAEFSTGVHGHVRIFASMSATVEHLPEDVGGFIRRHHTVRVSVEEKVSSEILRGVEDGRADLGICWNSGFIRNVQTFPYRHDRLSVVVHPSHPLASRETVSFEESLAFEHIMIQPGSVVQLTQQRQAVAMGKTIRSRIQVATFDAACRMVAANLAVAVIPYEIAVPFQHALGLVAVPMQDEWAFRDFVICIRDQASLSVPARLMLEHLTKAAQETPASAVQPASE